MIEKLEKIRDLINELIASIEDTTSIKNSVPSVKVENEAELNILKSLLDSNEWPEAVFSAQITDDSSEKDKKERAEGIVDMLLPPLDGKKFLDFGCGDGHVVNHVSKDASLAVGYDINKSGDWEKVDKGLLTQDFEKVKSMGPYDIILIYDVLDHVLEPMEDALSKVKSVLSENGKIYLRCHPWVSRHGGHAYNKINKAFIHLVFNDGELNALGINLDFNRKVLMPLAVYGAAIENANLALESEPELDTQELEEFFSSNPLIRSRILKSFGINEWKAEKPGFQLSQCFVDYILKQ